MKDIVTQAGSISLELTDELTDDVVKMLDDTLWGTEGGVRYTHTATEENLRFTKKAYFLNLRRGDNLLSSITLIHKSTKFEGKDVETYHIRYFAFVSSLQSTKQNPNKKKKKNSFLDQQLINFFNTYQMPESKANGTPQLFHAQVENDNLRSKMFTEKVGFRTIGKMTTLTFSRVSPSKHPSVRRATESEKLKVMELSNTFYKDYAFYSTENIGRNDDVFVLEENGEILVSAQAYKGHWKFQHLPGAEGVIAKYILPYIPYANRLFNFKNHRFITFEGLNWKKGHEHRVQDFIGSVLKEFNQYVSFLWMDPESEHYKLSKEHVDWGVLDHLNSGSKSSIIIRTDHEDEYDRYASLDKFISNFYIL
ncbi:hypothetical protein [Flammeovirga aprica]|uniref:Uncharacterized protein n=1 Tax=Flammeovirga aprica JL-4 TaxID=694437 RepID=A0A7X9S0E8_9BACT|nr:hypothetical protein [Flammeovirga aprica]NME72120.1 hypothetical protein [Flammeovirga aprica JL-4]